MRRAVFTSLLAASLASAVIIDRIAITVENSPIKDSDIRRDLRVTDFLNGQRLDMGLAARKSAASRLIDQIFIRREIDIGAYPTATPEEADAQLDKVVKQRFHGEAAFARALKQYDLTDAELRDRFQWQLTVLRFIDSRFKPAVLIPDEQIEAYYRQHATALQREHPGHASLEEARGEIRDILTGEEVNKQFFAWLDDQRKNTKVDYLEQDLR